MIGQLDFCVWDTVWFSMIFGDLRGCFRSFPVGYDDVSVVILADIATFLLLPVAEICGTFPVSVRVKSDGKTASIFRVYFQPVPF
jgi:hypothetical protein